ncbi:hypothetical protein I312_105780 [Cryptococcus bacillisporus CA1280]|uniref:uncharacterized protein n=1 Tax=Cryptococcus bacillisporus CA1280 TaxID=1296109 RepID=UPI0033671421
MGIVIKRPDLELRSELKDGLLAPLHRALLRFGHRIQGTKTEYKVRTPAVSYSSVGLSLFNYDQQQVLPPLVD